MTMSHPIRIALACFGMASLLSACATPSRFEWGGYEGALYAYAKKPELRPNYRAALERAIDQGRKSNRLAPGLLAELGYLDLEDHNEVEAVRHFDEEMTAFPESRAFLSDVVARLRGQAKKTDAAS